VPRVFWIAVPVVGAAVLAMVLIPHGKKAPTIVATNIRPAPTPAPEIHRARIHSDVGATFSLERGQPDELVRLRQGSIVVDVEPLHTGERFRVAVQNAEIEVHGTVFQVVAQDDRLERVDVWRGVVVVRTAGKDPVELKAGGHWEVPGREKPPIQRHQRRASAIAESGSSSAIAEAAFGDGWKALRANDFAEAAASFERAAAAAGDHPLAEDAWFWKAVSQARMGFQKTATASLAAFIQRFPRSPRVGEASAMLGWLLIEQDDIDGAAARFSVAAKDRVSNVRESARLGLEEIERLRR
jgi:TolA-binding protein